MKGFYLRWGVLLLTGGLITFLAVQHYVQEVRPMAPEQLLRDHPAGPVRLMGMVEGGSLVKAADSTQVLFTLNGNGRPIPVIYQGNDPDNLRELKTLVVVGAWDEVNQRFLAREINLVPNYGFITAAYLVMVPTALFLFMMERRVRLLYNEIKSSKIYESEVAKLE